MISRSEAREKMLAYLEQLARGRPYQFVILEHRTRDEDFGWVFFYNTKQFVETGDHRWSAAGNAPLIVDAATGELHVTGTGLPIEHYIESYRRRRGQGPPGS